MSSYREDSYFADRGLPARRGDAPSGEIVSFPASVQRRLDQAQALLRQNRPAEALSALQQAGAELARSSPELFALLVASQSGATRLVVEETQTETRTVENGRYALGVRYAHDAETTTVTKTVTKTIRLL